jgi:hypothetical protein
VKKKPRSDVANASGGTDTLFKMALMMVIIAVLLADKLGMINI